MFQLKRKLLLILACLSLLIVTEINDRPKPLQRLRLESTSSRPLRERAAIRERNKAKMQHAVYIIETLILPEPNMTIHTEKAFYPQPVEFSNYVLVGVNETLKIEF